MLLLFDIDGTLLLKGADAHAAAVAEVQEKLDAMTSAARDSASAVDEVARLSAAVAAAEAAATTSTAERDGAVAELARLRAELAEAARARDAAVDDAAHVRAEAQASHARAAETVAQWQERVTALEGELARASSSTTSSTTLNAERDAVVAERDALARELVALRAERSGAATAIATSTAAADADELAALRARVAELTSALAAHEPAALMTMRSLLEGLVPLHAGLDVAVDYIASFEDNDPAVSGHLRTLRLLTATLGRLLAERERGAGGAPANA